MPGATLFRGARVVRPSGVTGPVADFAVLGGRFEKPANAPRGKVVRLDGRVITPGFVDAHVHMTMTGLLRDGVDLFGVSSVRSLVARLGAHTRRSPDRFVWGYGWDDTTWSAPPTADAIERVAGDRHVYLARVDAHSALVSWKLFEAAGCADRDGVEVGTDGRPTGIVRRDAHHAVRTAFFARLPASQLRAAHRAAAALAVSRGVTTVHEMCGPVHGAGERDLDLLLAKPLDVSVVCYFATDDMTVATSRGLRTIGGDFNVDGSIGSRTAALVRPYADQRGHRGFLYRDAGDLAEFFAAATRAGLQAGVHCIGDAACEAAVSGLERAARTAGVRAVRSMRHRLEHFEMSDPSLIERAARAGAAFSVQPAFDREWGGDGSLYAVRLGRSRARTMNDFASMLRTGAVVGFGSDSPVTPLDGLAGVLAAARTHVGRHAVTVPQAFVAATAGAAALAREEREVGAVRPGMRADFVVWDRDPIAEPGHARIVATYSRGRLVYGER